jgi:nucleotide-binding universal stress UspA family protein
MQMFMQDRTAREEAMKSRYDHVKLVLEERQKTFWEPLPEPDQLIQKQIDSVEVIEGHPAEVILRRSKELSCNLIVLGAHSHGFTHTHTHAHTHQRSLRS